MTTEPIPPDDAGATTEPEAVEKSEPKKSPAPAPSPRVTRASAAWTATAVALLLLTLLVVFIMQNQTDVEIKFLWLSGSIPVGIALLVSAVASGLLVTVAGVARVTQLRRSVRRAERKAGRTEPDPD